MTIKDGKLDPDRVEGQVGLPFVLTVTGDAQPHTLVIEGLVTGQKIMANAQSLVQFTVAEGSEGNKDILLDGKKAGTFAAQSASGGTTP